ncbi:reverse transcriptase domain-containing protein [Tanacetum coccineum]
MDSSSSGNPTPSDPIIASSSPSFTPFEGGDFILEEIETFLHTSYELSNLDDDYYDMDGDILYLEKLLNEDPSPTLPLMKNDDLKQVDVTLTKPSIEEPPKLELKDLPSHLEYAFLEGTDKLPVIISKELKDEEKTALLKVIKSHKRAIAWKISDIKGIDPSFYTHKILMEDHFKPTVQHQRRVSLVHCVPKKGGMTVIENDNNELIPTRLVTGWRVCIDYQKLNDATRKDHFPLPFMDQMLERLAGNEYYCFLDGFSRYFQIPIDPKDQDKTTFTCPYRTFAYRRMPFGLCNAPGTFQRCMMAIFHDMIEETMEVFMDDFSVFGDSFSSCLSNLDKMLKRCEDTNLVLNWEKCHFMVKEGIVLGHKISKSGIEVDRAKVDVIAKLPHPTSVKGQRVGQVRYLRDNLDGGYLQTPLLRHNRGVLSWYDLSAMCHSKDSGPLQGLYLCRIVLRRGLLFVHALSLQLKTHIVFGATVFASCHCLLCSGFFPFLDDLNDLINKYKIPHDLYPRLRLEEFVMSELLDDVIGIYRRMFDFSGVQIPFSSFLMALIKHYRVHFSQLGPLGLNKVITFKVLCRSLQIEPMMALFRVFQTLCKQGDWFSFTKRRAPSPVCIDDNRSCMKHWKSGFFFINQRDIPDSMVWRHPSVAIDDPRPVAGSYSMADVRRLSAHVIKLRDMPEGVLVLSRLSRVWKNYVCDPVLRGANGNGTGGSAKVQEEPHLDVRLTLQRLPFYFTPTAAADGIIPDHTSEDLAVGDSDDESDGDDDACVEILLVTPLHSAAVIPPSGNQGGSSAAPAVEGSNSQGKCIMVDDAAAPSVCASRPRPSSEPTRFRDVAGDAIHANFFPFSAGPYYATYPEVGVDGNCEFTREEWDASYQPTFGVLTKKVFKDPAICKTMVDQFPTPREMIRVNSLSDDQLTAKMSVLHCMMMSHGGELLARYRRLNQSHHEYVLSADSRMKGYEEKVASLTGLELQVSTLKKQVSGLNDKLSSSDATFGKSKAKGKEMKKNIKSLTKSLDNLYTEVARLSTALNQATILKAKKDEEILRLRATPLEFSSFFRGQF